jgi:uncharacterized protein
MTSLTLGETAYCAGVLIFSYSLRGSSGFGSAVGMPLLALVIPVKVLAPAWTLLGVASSVAILRSDRPAVAYRELFSIAPWSVIGVGLGLHIFKTLDAQTLARALAVFILAYAAHSFWLTFRHSTPGRRSRLLTPVAGLLSGVVGTMFGTMASVFFAMQLGDNRLTKRVFRATMSAMLLALSVARTIGYIAVGEFTSEALVAFLAALPAMAFGIFLGNRVHARIDDTLFRRLLGIVLVLCAVTLLLR